MASRADAVPPSAAGLSVTDEIAERVLERPMSTAFRVAFALACALTVLFAVSIGYLLAVGVGIWGNNIPVAWGFAITSYVWWIGIGMSGTFISAALLLARAPWRASINRFAETMTIFSVAIAGLYPILHLGRPWFFYWLAPYPDVMNVWPQWRSPLVWDFFAIIAYLAVSLILWYTGLLPDLATLRDRAQTRGRRIGYGLAALGWRGEARDWARKEKLTLVTCGLAVPLVFSVHSVVGLDFAVGNTPGWHSTIFPPFFVAGALYSGVAMALVIAVPLRAAFGFEDLITTHHLDQMAKLMLAFGLLVVYSYAVEAFTAFESGDRYEIYTVVHKYTGAYAPIVWATIFCNAISVQALWFARVRRSPLPLALVAGLIVVGMWLERLQIIIVPLYRDFMPSAWSIYDPTLWDWTTLFGSLGFFVLLFIVFLHFLPAVSMADVRKERVRRASGAAP